MGELLDLVQRHEAADLTREQKIAETEALLATKTAALTNVTARLADAVADDEADELEKSKLRAQVAVLEQWKKEHETPSVPEPLPVTARFPGDPGEGQYMVGLAFGPNGRNSVAELKKTPQWNAKIKMLHDYASSGAKAMDHGSLKEIFDAGMTVASQSFKMLGLRNADGTKMTSLQRWQYVNAGKNDAEIRLSAKFCKTFPTKSIWACLHHEPEDDFTDAATQKEYRAAYRRVVRIFREEGVTNVAWAPIYMVPYTFESTRDFRNWHADWNGTGWEADQMMDLFGQDVYNPLPGASKNRSYKEMVVTKAETKTANAGMPYRAKADFEFGFGSTDADWIAYANEVIAVSRNNDVVLHSYWDSSASTGRYTLNDPTGDPQGKKKAAWDMIVAGAVS